MSNNSKSRTLSFLDGVGIIVGIIIGSGIFSSPGLALKRAGSPGATLFAWTAASILVSLACQCYFELGCMMPSAGGDYEYLNRTYGDRVAFSFAWFNFFISKPGSHAIIATIFGQYIETAIIGKSIIDTNSQESTSSIAKTASILLILCITLLNCYGLRESATFQNILTTIKFILVMLIFIIGFIYTGYNHQYIITNLSLTTTPNSFTHTHSITSFGSAMIACLWSYDGWCDIIFLMEDIQNPYIMLPRITLTSIASVTVCYILANIAYFSVLTPTEIMNASAIAYQMGEKTSLEIPYTTYLPFIFALGVAISTSGSAHGSIMAGGKALYAVARAGRAPSLLATMNNRGSPYIALLCQGAWGIILLSLPSSNFSSLLSYFGPASWFFYALSSSAVITLRYTQPSWNRPYKIPFYPLPVILVILIAAVIIVSAFMTDPLYTSLAFGFISLSIPIHIILEYFNLLPQEVHTGGGDYDDVLYRQTSKDSNLNLNNSDLEDVEEVSYIGEKFHQNGERKDVDVQDYNDEYNDKHLLTINKNTDSIQYTSIHRQYDNEDVDIDVDEIDDKNHFVNSSNDLNVNNDNDDDDDDDNNTEKTAFILNPIQEKVYIDHSSHIHNDDNI